RSPSRFILPAVAGQPRMLPLAALADKVLSVAAVASSRVRSGGLDSDNVSDVVPRKKALQGLTSLHHQPGRAFFRAQSTGICANFSIRTVLCSPRSCGKRERATQRNGPGLIERAVLSGISCERIVRQQA